MKGAQTRAKIIMIQGVSTNAGKSIVTGALCRYMVNLGLRVAPFKPILVCQNLVEENGITSDTRFVFSVHGARLTLSLDYNPMQILPIKEDWLGHIMSPAALRLPSGETCTVHLFARDTPIFSQIPEAIREQIKAIIRDYLNRLLDSFDFVVVEGAGNPTDIGISDLTNFFLVKEFKLTTILVTKLSAGGAAASLIGTYELLEPNVKETVAGFILNDLIDGAEIAECAARNLAERLNIPCLGILPNLWSVSPWESKDAELEGLAALVKEHIDMQYILDSAQ